MKVEKLLDVLSAYSKEEWNFHWRKCWKGHTKVSFFLFLKGTHTKNGLHQFPDSIYFPSLFFLWGLKFICEFWYFTFLVLAFMTREETMSKSGVRHYNPFTENLGRMNAWGPLAAWLLVLPCLLNYSAGKTKQGDGLIKFSHILYK